MTLTANGTALTGSPFKLNSLGNTEGQNFSGNAGTYAFSASYSGDPSFDASSGTSTLTISKQTAGMTLGYNTNNIGLGESVMLSTTISTTTYVGNAPTGTATFHSGTTALGAPVNITPGKDTNGHPDATASFVATSLPEGMSTVYAVYSGDANYTGFTGPSAVITVGPPPAPYFTLAAAGGGNVTAGSSVTGTATVTPVHGFTGGVNLTCQVYGPTAPTSLLTCSFNPTPVTITGATAVSSTLTVATTSATPAGAYVVNINASDVATGMINAPSGVGVTVVASGPATVALTPGPTTVTIANPGQSGTSTVSVTPNNYTGVLNLTCVLATAPNGANARYNPTCTVPDTLAITSSAVATTLASIATTAPASSALAYLETNRGRGHWYASVGGAALACMLFFGIPTGRRPSRKSMLSLLAFLVVMAGTGCGGGGGSTQNPGTPGTTVGVYTFTVTATDSMASTIKGAGTVTVTVN